MLTKETRNWWGKILIATLAMTAVVSYFVLSLNTPVSFERIEGNVTRLGPTDDKYVFGTKVFVALDDGRVVVVIYPAGAAVPFLNSRITITRAKRRFFGDVFAP